MCGFRRPVARRTSRLDLDKWPNRMSLLGPKATVRRCPRYFRFAPESRPSSERAAFIKSASSGHSGIPASRNASTILLLHSASRVTNILRTSETRKSGRSLKSRSTASLASARRPAGIAFMIKTPNVFASVQAQTGRRTDLPVRQSPLSFYTLVSQSSPAEVRSFAGTNGLHTSFFNCGLFRSRRLNCGLSMSASDPLADSNHTPRHVRKVPLSDSQVGKCCALVVSTTLELVRPRHALLCSPYSFCNCFP
jgi:hypothetical protein